MKKFPTSYNNILTTVDVNLLSENGKSAFLKLDKTGYSFRIGLTRKAAEKVRKLALESSIMEYCPNDRGSRFRDESGTTAWLQKGRAVFLLEHTASGDIAGYAWAGVSKTPEVPGGSVTIALRLSEKHQGKGLATPYLGLTIDATERLYGVSPKNLWLETWESNEGAVHIYTKLGFSKVHEIKGERPTADGRYVFDTRLFMMLDDTYKI